MKAAVKFLSAVSAVAMSAGLAVPASVVVQLIATSAVDAAVVNRIEVRGNRRVDAETIRSYVNVAPGRQFSPVDIDAAVKRLFGSGLFSDVRINQVGGTLVIEVDEYSIVNQVLFQGNKKVKDAQLTGAVQLKPRGTFSQAQLDADVEAVRGAYRRVGREDADVSAQVVELGENRVNVIFQINEGGRTKIADVNFVGNEAFSNRRLADVISTRRSNMLSFLFRNDIFDEERLRADEEALRRFYFNHGFADFQVISAVGELNEDNNEYTVTITVDEGPRYTFGDVSIESTIESIDSQALSALMKTRSGDGYSAKKVEDTIIAITERIAGMGYAFAQVTPRGDRNFENRTISIVYTVDEGPRTYVERIEIRGNSRTRDHVIRREFDVSEGDAFNQVLVQRAKRRLERLDYFERVEIATAPGSEPDQVILVVDVIEKSTGEFSIGAGYSTGGENQGINVEGSITERNFLGRGQFIKLSASGGAYARDFTLSFTEPYFLGRRISAGFDIYRQTRYYTNYDSELTGGTIRFGLPITENLTTQLAYNLTQEKYKLDDNCEPIVLGPDFPTAGCDISPAILAGMLQSPWVKSSVSATLLYNSIDDMRNPHGGIYAAFTAEYAGLGGDAEFVKLSARGNYYKTISEEYDVVGLLVLGGGHVFNTGGELRMFDLFKNNDRMIRGFEYNGMGPADHLPNGEYDHLGGTTYFHGSLEAQFPMPVIPESFGMRGAFFADAATLYGNKLRGYDVVSTDMEWRASVGASLIWASPFGPLRIDYAVPVMKQDSDHIQNFNFGMSTRF